MPVRTLTAAALCALVTSPALSDTNFNRIASFDVSRNIIDGDSGVETSAEIIAATDNGMTLIYTDSPLGAVGLIDISEPREPQPLGHVMMDGEPTSVAVIGETAYIGVNTSENYVAPSGKLAIFDIAGKSVSATCDLSGQPDSVAVAKDGTFVVIAIENERDEDLNDGALPQMPGGTVNIIPLNETAAECDAMITVDLNGVTDIAPTDPEPEFVDVNGLGETVLTLQENNHIVILDATGKVISSFSAGSVTLEGIDTDEEQALNFTGTQTDRLREPDAVKWIDDDHFAIANEGDYNGGSRGFTIFSKTGEEMYESGASLEHAIVEIGHYPEGRSGNKGVEPESIGFGIYGETPYLFVGTERSSVIGVYDATTPAEPQLKQLLPSGVGPEGLLSIPSRNLFITANETDLIEDGGVRAHVMIYELQDAAATYPSITSAGNDTLIGWGALSGLAAHPTVAGKLYAVNDSFYRSQPTIFEVDATQTPARITGAIRITRDGMPAQKLDMEGIFANDDGTFWIASEGRTDRLTPHALYLVNADGSIEEEIAFPAALLASERRFGAEGITRVGDTLWIAIQREWADDPADHVKLVSYNIESGDWGAVLYPKAKPAKGWVGLSEITAHGDYVYILERDNQIGAAALTKKLYRVPLAEMTPAELGGALPTVSKEEAHDFMNDLAAPRGYIVDKIEGFAIDAAGNGFAVTDNDGVDDSSGETHFIRLGAM